VAIKRYQQSLIDQGTTGSNVVMIFKKGEKIYHEAVQSGLKGDKPIDETTLFPIWSMTKPITTVAMMMLHEEGKFAWDDEVSKFLPCFTSLTWKDGDTIRPCTQPLRIVHLMTHRAGWTYPKSQNAIDIDGVPDVSFDSIYPSQTRFNDLQSFVEACAKTPLMFEPGSQYLYGPNQGIQGRLIEVISGRPLEEFLREHIFEPMGMVDTSFSMGPEQRNRFQPLFINTGSLKGFTYLLDQMTYQRKSRAHFGDAGLVSTMEDYSRFCEMLASGGNFRGKKLLSAESIAIMTKKWSGGFSDEPNAYEQLEGHYNGFSLFVLEEPSKKETEVPKGIYGWAGYHNTHFWIDPKHEMFGLFMSRARPFNWDIPIGLRKTVYENLPTP
ncbi:MAG: serine hydrolase domain-containing protein, partial [Planctomycetota bacterium]|nr:serine hydrolase domain-containing protein [Planctomycetota bacterium]